MPKVKSRSHIKGATASADPVAAKRTTVFKMNTGIGQHILKNPLIAQGIVDKADIRPSDIVLEVGPGTGNLTEKILEKARKVIAVEMDPRMAAELTKRFQGKPAEKKLEILLGDCIKTDLPYFDVCISNTPYQISSPLVFKLLNQPRPPRVSVLMFQKEFALRLLAKPGDNLFGRLAVNTQMWSTVKHVMNVGKNNFRPPPQVESAVVKIEVKQPRPNIDFAEWDGLLRVCFNRKNAVIAKGFRSSEILEILEKNYLAFLSAHPEFNDPTNYDDDEDEDMDMDNNTTNKRKKVSETGKLIKKKIAKVLRDTELEERRSTKCDENDYLRLLYAFHKVGIHFA
ncbi:dimethyladenosine transferase [Trichomonascus vanleenenianus]|uniref:putative dimethyladenosine transferase n=1 Tax=Trichomonascus vanleenenianus TaxID=2268995 RepID=UPI003EC9CC82